MLSLPLNLLCLQGQELFAILFDMPVVFMLEISRATNGEMREGSGIMAWTEQQPIVSLKDVWKSFGATPVLCGISFDVMKGDVICLIGPSGSGKSTLLRCVNALITIDRGSITVEGLEVHDPKTDILALRKKVGMVFQQYNLFPHKTAIENIMLAPIHVLKQNKPYAEENARRLLAKVRLSDKAAAYPSELSGGQQQRVAIARSLAMSPDIMLFDEVTAALDPETVKEVLITIRELAEEGMTCLIVTHEMGFAREIADHIYFTDRGVIVEHGRPAEFFEQAKDPRTRAFLSQIL
jgi:polar amino acid transport system ATP-binding protein